ncbi:MAG: CYTH domain-containing protein, partial [Elusimicrobiota bacterium]|nr:CYTH domain-containing protein [Elusimicrobiota bacterium]
EEYKWQAKNQGDFDKLKTALASTGLKATPVKLLIFDSYFDSPNGELSKNKTALRLRSCSGLYEITLKSKTAIKNGMACRSEDTITLGKISKTKAFALFKQFFRENWPGLGFPKQLFIIKNKRELFLLTSKTLSAELAFDNCNILVKDKNIKLFEIELEYKDGSREEFNKLAKTLSQISGLEFAKISKVATAVKYL